jgi:effector-binding domain-containing protein
LVQTFNLLLLTTKIFLMKLLKGILLIAVILLGVWVILAMMGPKEFSTSRSIVINASQKEVYKEVVDFNNWQAWSPWAKKDSTMVTTVQGEPGVSGGMSWTSADLGSGSQKCTGAIPYSSINTELAFDEWEGKSQANWTFEAVEGGTKTTWTMNGGELPFMIRPVIMLLDQTAALEADYDTGLANLKEVVENAPKFSPETEEMAAVFYIGKSRIGISIAELAKGEAHGAAYGEIGAFMDENNMQMAGMPICITHEYNEGVMDLTFAMPVTDSLTVAEGLMAGMIPAGKCLTTIHYGSYDSSAETWERFSDFIEENGIVPTHAPYEIYVNDPATVNDPSEIMTKIVFPI